MDRAERVKIDKTKAAGTLSGWVLVLGQPCDPGLCFVALGCPRFGGRFVRVGAQPPMGWRPMLEHGWMRPRTTSIWILDHDITVIRGGHGSRFGSRNRLDRRQFV